MNNTTSKTREFFSRWKIWIIAAVAMLAALSASRRAGLRLNNANQTIRDNAAKAIEEDWQDVDADVVDFLDAQDRGQKANEKLTQQLDQFAKSDDSARDIISDWNAANRLHDD